MKIKELIRQLKKMNQDKEIELSSDENTMVLHFNILCSLCNKKMKFNSKKKEYKCKCGGVTYIENVDYEIKLQTQIKNLIK